MKDKNLKRLFKIAIQEGIDLRYLAVYEIPTKEQFFRVLPADFEPTEFIVGDSTLKVYFAFNKLYCIDNDGNKYLAHNMFEAQATHAYNIRMKEIDKELKRLESTLTNK